MSRLVSTIAPRRCAKILHSLILLAALCTAPMLHARQQVGLVLSGGGAKGIAHIGVIQALEDNGIPIDYITGTSMGAIVGGLYASGYSPDEMLALIQSKGFGYWSTGTFDPADVYYFGQDEPMPRWATINLNFKDTSPTSGILPSSLISPLPMNIAFVELFAKYTAQCKGDFDRLFVPLRTVTSDVYHKHKVVCSSGSLGDAVRASMSFPIVFTPIEMDSVLVYDGGIYDNFPVDVMRDEFSPDIMIGVDVSAPDKKPERNNIMQQVEDMIIQNNDYSLPADEGIKLRVKVQQFGLLDFGKCMEIYRIGYDYALEMMDSIKARISVRAPKADVEARRARFKEATPKVVFRSVTASGASRQENEYVREMFTPQRSDTFGIEHARRIYYELVTPGHYRDLVPKAVLDTASGAFDLNLLVDPKKDFSLGLGGYIATSSNSMLFLSTAYHRTGFNALNVSLDGWIGQSYAAVMASGRINLHTSTPSYLLMRAVLSRQNLPENNRLFNYDAEAVTSSMERFAKLTYGLAAGYTGKFEFSIGGGRIDNKFYNGLAGNEIEEIRKSHLTHRLGMGEARFEDNTLDNRNAPVKGHLLSASIAGMFGRATFRPFDVKEYEVNSHPAWAQLSLNYRNFLQLNKSFSVGIEGSLVASSQKLLDSYGATMVMLPAFHPTPSSYDKFYTDFRAPQYAAVGVVPVWSITRMFQLRGQFHCFMPFRQVLPDYDATAGTVKAKYGDWFSSRRFFAEIDATYSLPFAQISAFVNYADTSTDRWNVGLSFGLYFLAPKFIP